MDLLSKDALKKDDKLYRGICHIMSLVAQMLSQNPADRPTASHVQERLYAVLNEYCSIGANDEGLLSRIHCEPSQVKDSEWDFGFDEARLASQRAAAEACAAVAPQLTEVRPLGLGNGGVIYGIERRDSTMIPIECDGNSIVTKSSQSSEGKSKASRRQSIENRAKPKPKAKAKAWQAPVYAEFTFGII